MVPQWRTSALLAEGVPVEFGTGVTGLTEDDSGRTRHAGPPGRRSTRDLRGRLPTAGEAPSGRLLGVGFEGSTHPSEQLFIADVRLTGLDRDSWHIWPGRGR